MMIKIQLLDDEPNILAALQRVLRREPEWSVDAFTDAQEALDALADNEYAVIISDYQMPNIDGVTYLQFAKQAQPHAMRMILSAHGDRNSMMQAINRAEIYRFLPKPWDDYELKATLRSAIDLHMLRHQVQRLLAQVQVQQAALQEQQAALQEQRKELMRLEAENPGLTQVRRDEDGAVLIDGLYEE